MSKATKALLGSLGNIDMGRLQNPSHQNIIVVHQVEIRSLHPAYFDVRHFASECKNEIRNMSGSWIISEISVWLKSSLPVIHCSWASTPQNPRFRSPHRPGCQMHRWNITRTDFETAHPLPFHSLSKSSFGITRISIEKWLKEDSVGRKWIQSA